MSSSEYPLNASVKVFVNFLSPYEAILMSPTRRAARSQRIFARAVIVSSALDPAQQTMTPSWDVLSHTCGPSDMDVVALPTSTEKMSSLPSLRFFSKPVSSTRLFNLSTASRESLKGSDNFSFTLGRFRGRPRDLFISKGPD